MNVTRRELIEVAATTALAIAAEQADAQQTGAVDLAWLGGEPPAIPTPVSWGVPFPRGTTPENRRFALTVAGKAVPLQQWPLAYWPDKSMKFIGFSAVVPSGRGQSNSPHTGDASSARNTRNRPPKQHHSRHRYGHAPMHRSEARPESHRLHENGRPRSGTAGPPHLLAGKWSHIPWRDKISHRRTGRPGSCRSKNRRRPQG